MQSLWTYWLPPIIVFLEQIFSNWQPYVPRQGHVLGSFRKDAQIEELTSVVPEAGIEMRLESPVLERSTIHNYQLFHSEVHWFASAHSIRANNNPLQPKYGAQKTQMRHRWSSSSRLSFHKVWSFKGSGTFHRNWTVFCWASGEAPSIDWRHLNLTS